MYVEPSSRPMRIDLISTQDYSILVAPPACVPGPSDRVLGDSLPRI